MKTLVISYEYVDKYSTKYTIDECMLPLESFDKMADFLMEQGVDQAKVKIRIMNSDLDLLAESTMKNIIYNELRLSSNKPVTLVLHGSKIRKYAWHKTKNKNTLDLIFSKIKTLGAYEDFMRKGGYLLDKDGNIVTILSSSMLLFALGLIK